MGLISRIEKKDFKKGATKSVETDIDRLYKIIVLADGLRLTEAALRLGIKEERAEHLAKVLEQSGIIKLRYPIFGKPYLQLSVKNG